MAIDLRASGVFLARRTAGLAILLPVYNGGVRIVVTWAFAETGYPGCGIAD